MIGAMVNIDAVELSAWTILPKFTGRGLQHGCNIGGTSSPKPISLDTDIELLRIIYGSLCTVHREVKHPENRHLNNTREVNMTW
jgi:hypothetical protein